MNSFWIMKVIAACDQFLVTGNTITDRLATQHASDLKAYALALASDGRQHIHLTIDDLGHLAGIYAKLENPAA